MTDEKSLLGQAIELRKPHSWPFDVNGIFGLAGKKVHKINVHVPRKGDEESALIAAHRHVQDLTQGAEAAREDQDIVHDAKAREIIQRACWDEDDSKQAFYGSEWINKNITGDQLGVLLNLVNEARRNEPGATRWDSSDDVVESIITLCVRASDTPLAERVMVQYQREYLTSPVVILALKIYELRRPGVTVTRDAETGKFHIAFPRGFEPDFEPLDEEALEGYEPEPEDQA